jgi:hypothetical protein
MSRFFHDRSAFLTEPAMDNQRPGRETGGCMANAFPHGTVHEAHEDLQAALRSDPKVFVLWESLTPLGSE